MILPVADRALRYRLAPNREASAALEETFERYQRMMEMLDLIAAEKKIGANLVTLHGHAYEAVRKETGLPSRLVTLGLRDRAAYKASQARRLPLDERLVNVKNASLVSINTVRGRFEIPFHVLGYAKGWGHSVPGHLVNNEGSFEIHFGVAPNIPPEQEDLMMAQQAPAESLFSRAGRLLAGIAVEAIERAEGNNRQAVVKQAIREIEAAEQEARDDLARERAQEWRLKARQGEISKEMDTLNAQIATAVANGRDDLAKAGIARQMDLEAQFEVVGKALEENEDKIETVLTTLRAIMSGLQDAETRLAELKKSEEREVAPKSPGGRRAAGAAAASAKTAKASRAIARTVGVPASMAPSGDIDELSKLHRDKEIAERLARLKSESGGSA
jgi:phage shock protein A